MNTRTVMVYLDEGDAANRNSVAALAIRVLATYPHGMLVEVNEEQLAALEGQGYRISPVHSNRIKLRAVTFDTSKTPPRLPSRLSLTPAEQTKKRKKDFWILQFVGPVKTEWKEQLAEAGVKFKNYIPENAYLVQVSTQTIAQLREMPFVNWVGHYEPAYKVSPALTGHRRPAEHDELESRSIQTDTRPPAPEGNITILLHDPADMGKVTRAVTELGGEVVNASRKTIIASLAVSFVEQLAKMVEVSWMEPFQPPELYNNVAAEIIRVQNVWDLTGLDGSGQIVAVADTGLDVGRDGYSMHSDFRGRIIAIHDVGQGGGADSHGHGTHVAGSVLGDGSASEGQIRGMAPAAHLVFQALNNENGRLSPPADYNDLFQQAYDDGARIHTNSWGSSSTLLSGIYLSQAAQIDEFMWEHKDTIILFAAGNDGVDDDTSGTIDLDSLNGQGCAKNSITVGASESNRPEGSDPPPGQDRQWSAFGYLKAPLVFDHVSNNQDGMAPFSSRGPTDDGRVKPDVVAPGTNILSARSSKAAANPLWGDLPEDDLLHGLYCWSGGTSMSTPLVAGVVALIRQYVMQVHRHTPSGALLKALLIHGATPLRGQYSPAEVAAPPDNNQGWGRVNLRDSLFPGNPLRLVFLDNPSDALDTGEAREYAFQIPFDNSPFRATLVWTDFPGSARASEVLVNQLRLQVTQPDGTILIGEPQKNNVQQVVIRLAQRGEYRVQVSGINVPEGPQDFALAVTARMDYVDLHIRDNNRDGLFEPRNEVLYESPDIWICSENDPNSTRQSHLHYRQPNYVFVRVRNHGSIAATDAKVSLYWAYAGTNLGRLYWRDAHIKVDGVLCNHQMVTVPRTVWGLEGRVGETVTAAFECYVYPGNIDVEPGDYYLLAVVTHPEDSIPQEDAWTIHQNNNIAWKHLAVKDRMPGSEIEFNFYVAGMAEKSVKADLLIDYNDLPEHSTITMKVPSRWLKDAQYMNVLKPEQSSGSRVSWVKVVQLGSEKIARLKNISLHRGENTRVELVVAIPENVPRGSSFTINIHQKIEGKSTGRIPLVFRIVEEYGFVANQRSGEIHRNWCAWRGKISPKNKVPYSDLGLALRRGYNGCRYCMTDVDTDPKSDKTTYQQIQFYVQQKYGYKPLSGWIAHVKELSGLFIRQAWNRSEDGRVVECPPVKIPHLQDAFRHFGMIL